MSGYVSYEHAHNPKYQVHTVPLRVANEQNLSKYGRLVHDFDKEEVWITPWPAVGTRALYPGTGINGGITSGDFEYRWDGEYLSGRNTAVPKPELIFACLPQDVSPNNRTHVLAREANYHPDGGQVFFPSPGKAFVLLLARPGDDVTPKDFEAFYFDGSCGIQIKAGVWHQPAYPIDDVHVFQGKQSAIYACMRVDTADEFNTYLKVPLKPELATQ